VPRWTHAAVHSTTATTIFTGWPHPQRRSVTDAAPEQIPRLGSLGYMRQITDGGRTSTRFKPKRVALLPNGAGQVRRKPGHADSIVQMLVLLLPVHLQPPLLHRTR
jgi:hypothetical protein